MRSEWTDSCTVSDLEIPFGSCSRPILEQSQCITEESHGHGTVWDHSLAYALVLYEHLDSGEFLQLRQVKSIEVKSTSLFQSE